MYKCLGRNLTPSHRCYLGASDQQRAARWFAHRFAPGAHSPAAKSQAFGISGNCCSHEQVSNEGVDRGRKSNDQDKTQRRASSVAAW
jgi:hypothetical protein